jgi:hypothetical protein
MIDSPATRWIRRNSTRRRISSFHDADEMEKRKKERIFKTILLFKMSTSSHSSKLRVPCRDRALFPRRERPKVRGGTKSHQHIDPITRSADFSAIHPAALHLERK